MPPRHARPSTARGSTPRASPTASASKSRSAASASRLRRAPSSSTNEMPKLTVTSPPSSQPTQPPLPIVAARVERPAEARDEEDRVAAAAPAGHLAVADHAEAAFGDALDAARRVEHELRPAGGRERVALHPGVLGGGELDLRRRLREEDAVVAGLGRLGRVVVGRLDQVRVERRLAQHRHHRDVAALLDARPGEVDQAEGLDRRVGPQVARVGELAARVGRVLDHPERRGRAGEDEAGRERADHRVDVAGEVLLLRVRGRRRGERERAQGDEGPQGPHTQDNAGGCGLTCSARSSIQSARPAAQTSPAASHSATPEKHLRPSRSICHDPITCGSPTTTGARSSAARLASTIVAAAHGGRGARAVERGPHEDRIDRVAVGGELRGGRPGCGEQVPPLDLPGEQAQALALRAPGAAREAGGKRMRVVEERRVLLRRLGVLDRDRLGHVDVHRRGARLEDDAVPVEQRNRAVVAPVDGERGLERRRRSERHLRGPLDERGGQPGAVAAVPGIGRPVEAGRDRERVRQQSGI